jgi:syntaxin 1B/2/3
MLRSSRPNQASSIYDIVEQRHEDVPYIEQQFNELNLLFNEMARIVQQQKPPVVNIEEKGEVVLSNVTTANKDFSRATNVIRSYNRKKWWCALVAVLVIIIVIVVVLVVVKLAAKPA